LNGFSLNQLLEKGEELPFPFHVPILAKRGRIAAKGENIA
jgi:hypothetical protein